LSTLRKQVEKALRADPPGPALGKLGAEGMREAFAIAVDDGHRLANTAAVLLERANPDFFLDQVLPLGLAGNDRALSLAATMGARAVERVLAEYPKLTDPQQRSRARLILGFADEERDPRVFPTLVAGLDEGDSPRLLARYGDAARAILEERVRKAPIAARPTDEDVDAQLLLLEALEETGPLPPDLQRKKITLQALGERMFREELDTQFDGIDRLAQHVQPLGHRLPGPKR
jgi:hypothetical protein